MANIVNHKETGKTYVLLGTGLGMYQSQGANPFGEAHQGSANVGVCCDEEGVIGWMDLSDLAVVSIDGATPASVLAGRSGG